MTWDTLHMHPYVQPPMSDVARRVWPVIIRAGRVLLALLWLGWAVSAWWTAPRPSQEEQARADLAAGRVVDFARIQGWDIARGFWGSLPSPIVSSDGPLLWWRTSDGRVHFASPDGDLPPGSSGGFVDNDRPGAPRVAALADEM